MSTRLVGRVSVRVMPDTSRFKKDLSKSLERLERSLEVKIPTVLDNRALREQAVQAKRDAERALGEVKVTPTLEDDGEVKRELAVISRQRRVDLRLRIQNLAKIAAELSMLSAIFHRPLTITLRVAALGTIIAALGVAVNSSTTLIANLLAINGVIGLMPALGVAAGAGIAALVVGFRGFGTALSGDLDEAKAALEGLTPNARAAALELRSFGPLLGQIRESVQETLFTGWAADLGRLGNRILPVVGQGLTDIAASASVAGSNLFQALSTRQMAADLNTTLANTAWMFSNMGPATRSWTEAFRDLMTVGSEFLPGLGQSITDVSQRFADFIARSRDDGSLYEWMANGIQAARDLGSVISGLGRILGAIGTAAQAAGGTNLAGLADLLHRVADTMNTPAFQGGLTAVFVSLQNAFAELGTAVGPIADMFIELAPTLGSLAETAGSTLAAALISVADTLRELSPLWERLAEVLAVVGPFIGDLAPVILIVVGAFKLFNGVMALTNALMMANPVTLIVLGIGALIIAVVALYRNFEPFRQLVDATWAALQGGLMAAWAAIKPIFDGLLGVLRDSWPQVQEVIGQFWDFVKLLFEAAVTGITLIVSTAVTGLLWIWENFGTQIIAYLTAAWNMVLGVISGALDVVMGIVNFFIGVFTGDWDRAWNGILQIVDGLWQIIVSVVTGAINILKAILSAAWQIIRSVATNAWNRIRDFFVNWWTKLTATIRARINAIRTIIAAVWATVRSLTTTAWNNIKKAVTDKVSDVLSTVRGIPGKIRKALGNTGRMLRQAGRNIIQGLINGLISMIGNIRSSMTDVINSIKDYLPWSPARRGPLRTNPPHRGGANIARMIAEGLESGRGVVSRAMHRVSSEAQLDGQIAIGQMRTTQPGRPDGPTVSDLRALADAVAALADRPVVVQVGEQEIARAVQRGNRQLERR